MLSDIQVTGEFHSTTQGSLQGCEVPFEWGHEVEVSGSIKLTGRDCDGVVVQIQY